MLSADSTKFFNAKSTIFRKFSPEYPPELMDNMLASMGFNSWSYSNYSIADIGSGAGQSVQPLLRRGFKVYCVDPSEKMIRELQEVTADFPSELCQVRIGTSADTALETESVHGIVLGNSLHWLIDANGQIGDNTLKEFRRILKPDGKVGVMFCMQKPGTPIYNIVNDVCTEVLDKKYTMHPHNLSEVYRHEDYARQLIESNMMVQHVDTYRRTFDSVQVFRDWLSSFTFVADAEPHQQQLITQKVMDKLRSHGLVAIDGSIPMTWSAQAYIGPLKTTEAVYPIKHQQAVKKNGLYI